MFSVSHRRHSVPVLLEDNCFQFYFVINQRNNYTEPRLDSPYHSFQGLLWTLVVYPIDSLGKQGIGLYLRCAGPDTAGSDEKISRMWSCAVRFRFTLLHPSKWASMNIDPDINGSGLIPSDLAIPPCPKDHVSNHRNIFQYDDIAGTGRYNWASYALLQPGLFCDNERRFVLVCQLNIHDYFNEGNSTIASPPSSETELNFMEFKKALEERAAIVEKIVQFDEFLRECKAPAVALVFENEIKTLERTLDVLPPLDIFL